MLRKMPPGSRVKNLLSVGAVLSVVIACVVAWDLSRFIARYESEATLTAPLPKETSLNEAIVVLTGDKGRIPKALELLRERGSPLLIISGVGKGATLVDVINNQGGAAGNIRELWNRIELEAKSQSTIENVYESGKILLEKKNKRVILVTSDYHMPRSLGIFRRVLPQQEIFPYPIKSDNSFWYNWNEYWKNRIFFWYGVKSLIPLQKSI
jgi:uncharacterized SAM-binding protein YcdF (DUF218 family)